MPEGKLTLRQERFVKAMTDGTAKSQADAARIAGYADSEHGAAAVMASENLSKPKIAQAIAEAVVLRPVTVDRVLTDIQETAKQAAAAGQFSVAMRGHELHGKHLGMFADRVITRDETRLADHALVLRLAGQDADLAAKLAKLIEVGDDF